MNPRVFDILCRGAGNIFCSCCCRAFLVGRKEPGQEPRRDGQRDARKVLRDNRASVNGISNIVTWALTTFDCSRQRCLARALRGIDVDPRRAVFEFEFFNLPHPG